MQLILTALSPDFYTIFDLLHDARAILNVSARLDLL